MAISPKRIVLSAPEVDSLRRVMHQGQVDALSSITLAEITLDGAVELACAWWAWRDSSSPTVKAQLELWAREHELLDRAWAALRDRHEDQVDLFDAPDAEVRATPGNSEALLNTSWAMYFDRFRRSLVTNGGFEKKLADGITGAFQEMVDNVVQHSGDLPKVVAPGIVGYHIRAGEMHYAVGDIGRGVLGSLRTNPSWSTLTTAREALDAAIRRHATRRVGEKEGTGFLQVHKSLADLNGRLRFRSGDAVLTLDGRGAERQGALRSSPPLQGFQMSVSCLLTTR